MSEIERVIREAKRLLSVTESAARERMTARYAESWSLINAELEFVTATLEAADLADYITPRGRYTRRGLAWRQQRLTRLLTLIEQEYARTAPPAMMDLIEAQRRAVALASGDAAAMAPSLSAGVGGALNVEAYERLIAAMDPDSPVYKILLGYGPEAGRIIEATIVQGAIRGQGVDTILREIRAQLPGGLPRWRLETLVRSELMRSYRGAMFESLDAMGVKEWQWTASLSGRTCASCLALHGQRFPITQKHMPAHPACRCVGVPVVEGIDTPSGEQWLRDQPEATQRKVLPTPSAYDAWSRGDVTLDDFVGYRRSRTWGRSVYVKPTRDVLGATR